MALKPLNSAGGFSVGENRANVILSNGDITTGNANLTGNLVANGVVTDTFYYANGDTRQMGPSGSNTEVQFNNDGEFGSSANLTFDSATGNLSVSGSVIADNVDANTISGSLTTASQPNITSVGTLSNLQASGNASISGNLTVGGVKTDGYYFANGEPFATSAISNANTSIAIQGANGNILANVNGVNRINVHSVGTLLQGTVNINGALLLNGSISLTQNLTTNSGTITSNALVSNTLSVNGVSNLNSISNVIITGGSSGQMIITDGAGNLSFSDAADTSAISNGTSSVTIAENSNVTTIVNNVTRLNVYDTGAEVTGTFIVDGNIYANATYKFSTGNANISSDGNSIVLGIGSNPTDGVQITGSGRIQSTNGAAALILDDGSNVETAGQLTVGSLAGNSALVLNANSHAISIYAGNSLSANYSLVLPSDIASSNGQVLTANTDGTLAWSNFPSSTAIENGTSNVSIPTANGDVTISANGIANVVVVSDSGLTVTGGITVDSITGGANTGSGLVINAGGSDTNIVLTPTGNGVVDVSSTRITNLATPTSATDAATKGYVDSVAEGLHVHASVVAATTDTLANISGGDVTYDNGSNGVGATLTMTSALSAVDGVSLSTSDRVLVKNESNTAYNGIYAVTNLYILTRASDFDTAADIAGGDFLFVTGGTVYNSTGWVQIDEVNAVGTDPVVFEQFSGAGTYTAGSGLTLTGSVFSVNTDGITTEISGGNVVVKANALFTTPNIGAATGTSIVLSGSANVDTLNVTGVSNLGNVGNVRITGGTLNQFLKTDGNGNLSFETLSSSGINNGTSNVSIPTANGNVTISANGAANVVTVTGTGVNVAGYANITGVVSAAPANVKLDGGALGQTLYVDSNGGLEFDYVRGNGNITEIPFQTTGKHLIGSANFTWSDPSYGGGNSALLIGYGTDLAGNLYVGNGNVQLYSTNLNFNGTAGNITGVRNISANFVGAANATISTQLDTPYIYDRGNFLVDGESYINLGNDGGANYVPQVLLSVNVNSSLTQRLTVNAAGIFTSGNFSVGNALSTSGIANIGGNLTAANISTAGVVSATGTITGGNLTTGGIVSATGNVTGGNLTTAGVVSATGNITGGNLTTAGVVSATGNVSGGNLTADGTVSGATVTSSGTMTATGNLSGGNISTAGALSVTGNANVGNIGAAAGVFTGNITGTNANLSGNLVANVITANSFNGSLANGSSNVRIPSANGNVVVSAAGNANVLTVTGTGVNVAGTLNATGNVSLDASLSLPQYTDTNGGIDNGLLYTTTGGLVVQSPYLTMNANSSDALKISSNVASNSTTSGALQVVGGAGITGNLYVGGNFDIAGVASFDNLSIDGELTGNTANFNTVTIGNANIGNFIGSTTNVTINANGYLSVFDDTGNVTLPNNLIVTNNITTEDLDVNGNIDVSGNLNVTGAVAFTGNLTAANFIGRLANGNSNVHIPDANGNVTISAAGNANVIVVTGTGANITGTANVTGNTAIGGILTVTGNANAGNIGATGGVFTGNVTAGNFTGLFANGNSNVNIPASNGNVTVSVGGTSNSLVVTSTGIVVSGNVTSNIINANVVHANSSNTGQNFKVGDDAWIGDLNSTDSIYVTGTTNGNRGFIYFGNSYRDSNVGGIGSLGRTANGALTSNGAFTVIGNLTASNISGPLANGTSNVNIATANGNVTVAAAGNSVLTVTGTGANVSGTANITGNAAVGGNLLVTGTIISNASNTGQNFRIGDDAWIGDVNLDGTFRITGVSQSNRAYILFGDGINPGSNIGGEGTLGRTGNGALTSNGAFTVIGNLTASNVIGPVANGNTNLNIPSANGNMTMSVAGNANVVVVTGTGINVAGTITSTGNVSGGNITTAGVVSATGNVSGGNLTTAGALSVTGNANVGNLGTAGSITATGNITGGNLVGTFANGNSNVRIASNSNVAVSVGGTSNVFTVTTTGANVSGTVNATGNANFANVGATVGSFTGNVTTPNIVSTSSNVVGIIAAGNTSFSVSGTGANVSGTLGVTGNLTGTNGEFTGNVVTNNIVGRTDGVTITAASGNNSIVLAPTGTGTVDVSSKRITSVAEPVDATDAATKGYVDSVAQGLHVHASANAATTGTLATISGGTVTYNNGTDGVGATLTTTGSYTTIDGVTLSDGMRILVKNESNNAHNGIYVRTSSTVLTRATDFDTGAEIAGGDFLFVTEGTLYNSTGWVQIDEVTTVGTDPIEFEQFSGAGEYNAGTGLTLTGSTFSIANTTVTSGSYGDGDTVATFTVNSQGQLTAASNVSITANAANLTGTTLAATVVNSSLTSVGTLGSLSVTGNVSAGNVSATGAIDATGNLSAGNISTTGEISATGNVSGGNLTTTGSADITGNLSANNVSVTNDITASTGNIATFEANVANVYDLYIANTFTGVGTNVTINANGFLSSFDIDGNVSLPNNLSVVGTVSAANLSTSGGLSVTGNLSSGNISTGEITASGNVIANANLSVTGFANADSFVASNAISATGNITGGNLSTGGTLTVTGNANVGNIGAGEGVFTGNVSAVGGTFTGDLSGANISTTGTVSATGNVSGGNITTTGAVEATGNVSGGNLTTSGALSVTGNANVGNIGAATGEFSAGVNTANLTANGTVTLGNVGNVKIDGGSNGQVLTTDGSGNLSFVSISTSSVSNGNSSVSIATADGNVVLTVNNTSTLTVTETGANVTGTLDVSGNATVGNLSVTDVSATTVNASGNVSGAQLISTVADGTAPFVVTSTTVVANLTASSATSANVAQTVSNSAQPNITSVGTLTSLSVTGNASAGNISTDGALSVTGNASVGNISATDGSFTGNVTTVGLTANGAVNLGSVSNITISGGTANYFLQTDGAGNLAWAEVSGTSLTNGSSNVVVEANGNISFSSAGNANVMVLSDGGITVTGFVSATANVSGNNLTTGGEVLATGNVTGGNIITGGIVQANGNVSGSNLTTTGSVDATGNVSGGNITTTGVVNATGNVSGGNLTTTGSVDATGNVSGGNITTGGQLVSTVTGVAPLQVSSNIEVANLNAQYANIAQTANVANTVSDNAQPNITSVGTLTSLDVTGNVTAAAFVGSLANGSSEVSIATSGGDIAMSVNATSNVVVVSTSGANITGSLGVSGNASAGNISTAGEVSASGNITSNANVITDNILSRTGNITIAALSGNNSIILTPTGTGHVDVSNTRIINIADPINNQDAATKGYVDSVAEGLHIHASVATATPDTLANVSSGTVTYDNGTGGVGATLTTTGSFSTIDGVSLTTDDRVLVKNESTAAHNGIYVYTSSTVLTRADDFDTPAEIDGGDFVFVNGGTTYADTGWVQTELVPVIGTDPMIFQQFSGAGTFTAGTGLSLTGTVFSIANTGVTANTYGNATTAVSITVNDQGQITNITESAFTVDANAISGSSLSTSIVTSNLTSVGTLTSLDVSGNVTFGEELTVDGNITSNAVVTGNGFQVVGGADSNFANIGGTNATFTGTVTASTFTGDLANGTSSVSIPTVNGNIALSVGGNVIVVTSSGAEVTGTLSSSGNLSGANITTAGIVSATGNVSGGNITTGGVVSATGNVSGGNITTGGVVSATGNVTGANVHANTAVEIGNTSVRWGTLTTVGITANQTIATFSTTGVTGVEFLVKGVDSTGGKYSVATVQAVTDGANVDYAIYGDVTIGSSTGTLVVNINGGNIELQVTPSSSNSTVWTTQIRVI